MFSNLKTLLKAAKRLWTRALMPLAMDRLSLSVRTHRAMNIQLTVRIQVVVIPLQSSLVSLSLVDRDVHSDWLMIDYKSEDKLSHVSTGGG